MKKLLLATLCLGMYAATYCSVDVAEGKRAEQERARVERERAAEEAKRVEKERKAKEEKDRLERERLERERIARQTDGTKSDKPASILENFATFLTKTLPENLAKAWGKLAQGVVDLVKGIISKINLKSSREKVKTAVLEQVDNLSVSDADKKTIKAVIEPFVNQLPFGRDSNQAAFTDDGFVEKGNRPTDAQIAEHNKVTQEEGERLDREAQALIAEAAKMEKAAEALTSEVEPTYSDMFQKYVAGPAADFWANLTGREQKATKAAVEKVITQQPEKQPTMDALVHELEAEGQSSADIEVEEGFLQRWLRWNK